MRTIMQQVCLGAVLSTALSGHALAQGSRGEYDRAASLREAVRGTVVAERIRPRWLEDGRCWYRVELADGRVAWRIADPRTGRVAPAFDHQELATSLSDALQRSVTADRLPLEQVTVDADGIRFRVTGAANAELAAWRWTDASGTLAALDGLDGPTLAPRRRPRPSRNGGEETSILFRNDGAAAARLLWVDGRGAERAYGSIAPGTTRRQHTFAGHVWRLADDDDRTLGVFEAAEEPSLAVVGDDPVAVPELEPSPTVPRGTSPDGAWQAVLRDHDVWIRRHSDGSERRVTTDGSVDESYQGPVHWAPDSSRVVVRRVRRGGDRRVHYVEAAPREQLQPVLRHYDYLKPGDPIPRPQPILIDVVSGSVVPIDESLTPNPWSIGRVHWAPDSSRFFFLYNERGHQVLRVLSVDASTGDVRTIIDERSPTFVDYAGKFHLTFLDDTGELVWMSERDGWNHLYLIDSTSGAVLRQLTSGPWVVRGVDEVDADSREVRFRAGGIHPDQDPYHVHHARVSLDGGGPILLTEGDGTHEITLSPDRAFFVDRWSRVDQPPITELRRVADGSLVTELGRADWSPLLATGWRPPERFVAPGRDGATPIHGVIWRPSSFDPNVRYPVVEHIYAGPHAAFVPKAFRSWHGPQSIAELGFIVVQIDGMGTSHRSKAFHDVCWRNLGDSGFPDRIAWMKAAAQHEPSMDLSRVGIYGGSAGGQSALRALLAHGDFYGVAVADCGCHDNRMDKIWWNELWMGWPIGPHYEEQSNVTQAHRLEGDLLLIVGAMDENVDPASTMQVVDALIRADRDFDLLVMPSAGHGAAESPYGRRRRADFLVRHLHGVEPRWERDAEE